MPLRSLGLALLLTACGPDGPQRQVKLKGGSLQFQGLSETGVPSQSLACYDDAVCLLAAPLSVAELEAGRELTITFTWWVRREPGKDWKIFLHGTRHRSEPHRFSDDHVALGGRYPSRDWRRGDRIVEKRQLRIPHGTAGGAYELWGGLYRGQERLKPSSGTVDQQGRALWGIVSVIGKKRPLPTASVRRLEGELALDGRLDEPAWQQAQVIGPFEHYDGHGHGRFRTTARLLWDDEALYVGFDCPDDDVHSPYRDRDEPVYESEAVEIFLDPDGDRDAYVELQVAPTGARFDAAFKGGARQGMNAAWNHDYKAAVHVRGSLNQPGDKDEGWSSEWRIPFEGLEAKPEAKSRWKANLFRLDRRRNPAGQVTSTDATAWSAPMTGDFHRLERFGTLVFEGAPPKPEPDQRSPAPQAAP